MEEEIRAELAAIWAAVSKMASSLMWRTGHEIVVSVPQVMEESAMEQETIEGVGEMQEIIAVSDAVEGISPRERVQQRTPEQIEDVPQYQEESVDAVTLAPHGRVQQPTVEETVEVGRLVLHAGVQQRTVGDTVEVVRLVLHARVQQRSAETIEVVPQSPEETVEVDRLVLHERVQQWSAETIDFVPHSPQETVEVDRLVLHERVQQWSAETIEVVPQSPQETVEVGRLFLHERFHERTVGVPRPLVLEETIELGRFVPHERVQHSTAEQIEDAPQSSAEVVEAVTLQLLHSLRNMGREHPMRCLEKLLEKRILPAGLEGCAELIQRFPFEWSK